MSSSGQGGSGGREDKPKGLAKFMRRASMALKRDKSKRQSMSTPSEPAPVSGSVVPMQSSLTPATSSPVAAPESPKKKADTAPTLSVPAGISQIIKENRPSPTASNQRASMTAKENCAIEEEKARALFAKYGFTLEPGEWIVPATVGVPRVEKQVRMRIHRTCHRCQTTFGADRVCNVCQHTRCKKCPRFPESKSKFAKGKGLAVAGVAADDGLNKKADPLTTQHRATGNEVVSKAPTQRVRRTCHQCETLFQGKATQCENCKHLRCAKCPRDPPKISKYRGGYPGDTEETVPSATRDTTDTGYEKGDEGSRHPPESVQRPLDDDAVKSVEDRMKNLHVSLQASAD